MGRACGQPYREEKANQHAKRYEAYRNPSNTIEIILRSFAKIGTGLAGQLKSIAIRFRPKRQCRDVVFVLRTLTDKSIEWRQPIFIADGTFQKHTTTPNILWLVVALSTRASLRSSLRPRSEKPEEPDAEYKWGT